MADETRVQAREVKKGMEAAGSIIERYMIRILGPIGRRIEKSTRVGRIMALIGVVTMIVCAILILLYATQFSSHTGRSYEYIKIIYVKKGYGYPFLAGVALFIIGIIQKGK